ncbi:hypothetical protein CYY_005930, partial [Polysphondylium violaceum]
MNQKSFALLLVVLYAIVGVCLSFIFDDVTPPLVNDRYAEYLTTTSSVCKNNYEIILVANNVADTLDITGTSETVWKRELVYSDVNVGKYLYSLSIELPSSPTQTTFSIRIQENGVDTVQVVNYLCPEPPTPMMEVISDTLQYDRSGQNFGEFPYFLMNITNLDKAQPPPMTAGFNVVSQTLVNPVVQPLGANIFRVGFSFSTNYNWDDIDIDIYMRMRYPNGPNFYGLNQLSSFLQQESNLIDFKFTTYPQDYILDEGAVAITNIIDTVRTSDQHPFLMSKGNSMVGNSPFCIFQDNTDKSMIKEKFFTVSLPVSEGSNLVTIVHVNNSQLFQDMVDITYTKRSKDISFTGSSHYFNVESYTLSTSFQTSSYIGITVMVGNFDSTNSLPTSLPYGLERGNANDYIFQVDFVASKFAAGIKVDFNDNGPTVPQALDPAIVDTAAPVVHAISHRYVDNFMVIQMNIQDDYSGFYDILNLGSARDIISGNTNSGVYEFLLDLTYRPLAEFIISDTVNNNYKLMKDKYLTTGLDKLPDVHLELAKITNITFKYSEIDVSTGPKTNVLYIHYPSLYGPMRPTIEVSTSVLVSKTKIFYGVYDYNIEAFKFNIEIQKNHINGPFYYSLAIKDQIIFSPQLRDIFGPPAEFNIKSILGDAAGPIITTVQLLPKDVTIPSGVQTNVTWRFTIEDSVNGLKNGTIVIQSSLDLVYYTIEISPESKYFLSGDRNIGIYEVSIPVNGKCKSQKFSIFSITLFDQQEFASFHSIFSESSFYDPLMRFIDQIEAVTVINTMCQYTQTESNPPQLVSFNPKTIDVTYSGLLLQESPRLVTFDFEAFDESGIMLSVPPKIYLFDIRQKSVQMDATLVSHNDTNAVYQCKFEIPYGFGFSSGISVALYGIVDNQSNFKGYPSTQLPVSTINVLPTLNMNISILSTTPLSTKGGSLNIFGKLFSLMDKLIIQDKDMKILQTLGQNASSNSLFIVNDVQSFDMEFVYLTMKRDYSDPENPQYSNTFKLFLQGYVPSSSSGAPSSENGQDSLSSDSNIPTNSPQSCINLCSGHGDCTSNGCLCKSPWVGLDCSS